MALNINSFFSKYIINPFSMDLTAKERAFVFVSSLAIAIITIGITHGVRLFLDKNRVEKMKKNGTALRVDSIWDQTTDKVAASTEKSKKEKIISHAQSLLDSELLPITDTSTIKKLTGQLTT